VHFPLAQADYFISSVVGSLSDPAVDGTFTDDVGGLPEEHGAVMKRINMNNDQLAALRKATTDTHTRLVGELVKAGKYNWQAFSGAPRSPVAAVQGRPPLTGCWAQAATARAPASRRTSARSSWTTSASRRCSSGR